MTIPLKRFEFVSIIAFCTSLTALAIDAMLPALYAIRSDLGLVDQNEAQLVISFIFIGMGVGQLFYGPLSDLYGRKRPLEFGLMLFMIGALISALTQSFEILLLGRLLQGLGAASTRVITTAIIRDFYVDEEMAKIVSLVMMIFVIVPAVAPGLGQIILYQFNWRYIFYLLFLLGLINYLWFMRRMPESLPKQNRLPPSKQRLKAAILETLSHKNTMLYTVASGLIFGAFIGYLISSSQIFTEVFDAGEDFPLYFGTLALAIGSASFFNSRFVSRFGMLNLTMKALVGLSLLGAVYLVALSLFELEKNLVVFLIYMMFTFFCIGILFGNFNALAISPLGHIAGMATAIISSIQTFLSLVIGSSIGAYFNGTVYPLVISFLILSLLSHFILRKV